MEVVGMRRVLMQVGASLDFGPIVFQVDRSECRNGRSGEKRPITCAAGVLEQGLQRQRGAGQDH